MRSPGEDLSVNTEFIYVYVYTLYTQPEGNFMQHLLIIMCRKHSFLVWNFPLVALVLKMFQILKFFKFWIF